ncbi:hypothetical protein HYY73_02895 [Candidatus Woesearchaeota archaeon]|nr:hypothetical protein [Candidatus Woesearchaeota archaeon]
MKRSVIIAALFLAALSALVAACGRVEPAVQQPAAENVSEIAVKEGCDYNNPPCGESYDCVDNACTLKSGCDYSNPPCNTSYECISNSCLLKSGCSYSNPACDLNHSCIGNQCILKTGCKYNNPPCNSSQICQNNKCFEHILSSGGGGY